MNEESAPQDAAAGPSMKPFFILWSGQAASLLGSQVAQFALIWWLTLETGSAKVLALASFVGLLPQILLAPFTGAIIDRSSRRRVMAVADSIIALASLALAVFFFLGAVTRWHVLGALLIRAVASGFHRPAMTASTSLMVPKEHLARIQGLNQTLQGALTIAAAPLGALLLEIMPIAGILGLDVLTAFCGLVPLAFIPVPQPQRSAADKETSLLEDISAGWRYVLAWPGLVALVVMSALINLFMAPASSLIPLLVQKHFGGEAGSFAGLVSVFGAGLIVGGIFLGAWGGFKRRIATTFAGLLGLSGAVFIIALVPSSMYSLAVVAMFLMGFMVTMTNGPIRAVLQATVTPKFQGRVFTLVQMAALAAVPIGLAIAGPVADAIGVQSWFFAGAVMCGLMGVLGFVTPMVLNIEDQVSPAAEDTGEVAE